MLLIQVKNLTVRRCFHASFAFDGRFTGNVWVFNFKLLLPNAFYQLLMAKNLGLLKFPYRKLDQVLGPFYFPLILANRELVTLFNLKAAGHNNSSPLQNVHYLWILADIVNFVAGTEIALLKQRVEILDPLLRPKLAQKVLLQVTVPGTFLLVLYMENLLEKVVLCKYLANCDLVRNNRGRPDVGVLQGALTKNLIVGQCHHAVRNFIVEVNADLATGYYKHVNG